MNIVDAFEYRGHTINIVPDEDPSNPRIEDENVGVMFCKHDRYILGDKDAEDPFEEVQTFALDGAVMTEDEHEFVYYTFRWLADDSKDDATFAYYDELAKALSMDCEVKTEHRLRPGVALCIPLGLYDHSGITIFHGRRSLWDSAGWDSGQVGWHYVTKAKVDEEWNGDLDKARACLEGEVRIYDDYLTGSVYGYVIDEDGDSCWGFFGYEHEKTGLLEYARNAIDCQIKQEEREAAEFMREESIRKDTEGLTCD